MAEYGCDSDIPELVQLLLNPQFSGFEWLFYSKFKIKKKLKINTLGRARTICFWEKVRPSKKFAESKKI
jgi:hypothetical protein